MTQKLVLLAAQGLVDKAESWSGAGDNCSSKATSKARGGAKFALVTHTEEIGYFAEEAKCQTLCWASSHKRDHLKLEPPKEVLGYAASAIKLAAKSAALPFFPEVALSCFTECKKGEQIYRAHPRLHREGAWFDWACFRFERESGDDSQEMPGQAWLFLDLTKPLLVGSCSNLRPLFPGWVGNLASGGGGRCAITAPMHDAQKPSAAKSSRSSMGNTRNHTSVALLTSK